MERKKVVVIGAGHNSLVAAAYLAKAGHEVTVLESRTDVGGAASTDSTTFPGFKISSASYLNSLFLREIVDDLELKKYGYEVLPRDPSSFTPLPDGRSLLLGPDMARNQAEIGRFSSRDAEAYPHYEHTLGGVAEWMAGLMKMTPPNIPPTSRRDWKHLSRSLWYVRKLFPFKIFTLLRLVLSDPVKYLDSWFESDVLKATLLTDAMIGAVKLSGYVLLHHVMGDAGGARGVWGYMRGGMGGISRSLKLAGEAHGVRVICNAKVKQIVVRGKKVSGVVAKVTHPGVSVPKRHTFEADIVVSGIDPAATFNKLLSDNVGAVKIASRLRARDHESASMKINCTLNGLPDFKAMPGTASGPQHRGTIHISPSVEQVLSAWEAYRKGSHLSAPPVLEITLPSVLDDTLAPPGKHVMNIFLQFYPYERTPGEADKDCRPYFWDVVMPLLREYITNIDEIVDGVQVLSPRDLEREFGLIRGNIFHGGMGLGQLFSLRPLRGMADYRTPFSGLYLASAGTHPGGGVTGASGYNAVREILADMREEQKVSTPYFFPGH